MKDLLTTRALLLLAGIILTLVLVPAIAYVLRVVFPSARNRSIPFLSLRVAALLAAVLMMGHQIADAPSNLTNDHRLAPSAALLHGFPAYYPPEEGPALSTIYGPVTIWTYLPAAAVPRDPGNAVRVGVAINIAMYYLPMIFLLWVTGRFVSSSDLWDWALVIFGLTAFNQTLSTVAGLLHADAPAIGWSAMACALLFLCVQTGKSWYLGAAGFAVALSVLAKQVMLPIVPVLGLYVLIALGWRYFAIYCAAALGSIGALLTLAAASMGGWQAMTYNILYIPTHQPYRREELVPALDLLLNVSVIFAIPALAGLTLHAWDTGKKSLKTWVLDNPSLLLLTTGAALSVTSILGKIKVVGSINTLSPTVYLFMAAALVELQRMNWPAGKTVSSANAPSPGRRFAGTAIATAVLSLFVLVQLPEDLYHTLVPRHNDSMSSVYAFSKKHPDELYFPQFPLSVLLAENRLYHFAWGLSDRAEAGRPVDGPYFHEYIPRGARVAAMVDWVWSDEINRYLGKEVQRPDITDLPGFKFYEIRDEPLARDSASAPSLTATTRGNE